MLPFGMFAAKPVHQVLLRRRDRQPYSPRYQGMSVHSFRVGFGFPFPLPQPLPGSFSTALACLELMYTQAGFQLRDPPASPTASQVLGLKAHPTEPIELPCFLFV